MKIKIVSTVIFLLLAATWILHADGFWPETQKNSYRTGRADLSGNINEPIILWKYYRGGYINPSNAAVDDHGNVYFSINGVVKAFNEDIEQMWETYNFGAVRIFRITDLDKNGEKELLVSGTAGISIISAVNGSILSTIGTESPSFLKIADVNQDGFDDILVRGRNGTGLIKAYGLYDGVSSPFLMWQITENIPVWGFEVCAGDVNDDGEKELVFDRMQGGVISVFKADDGMLLRDKDRLLAGAYSYGFNQIINLDGDIQKEFIFSGSSSSATDNGSFSITVYDYVQDTVQWQYEYGYSGLDKGFRMVPGSIADFNGDGIIDVAVSVFNNTLEGDADKDGVDAPDVWTTIVYRADNGLLQARLDNTYLEGAVDLDGDGTSEFILKSAPDSSKKLRTYSTISAYSFDEGDFLKLWSKDKVRVVTKTPEDTEDVGVVYVTDVPATVKMGSNDAILLIEDINRDGVGDKLFSVSGVTPTPVVSDVAYLKDGKNFGFIDSTDSSIYLTGNDGFIHIFDRETTLKNERTIETGTFSGDSQFINSSNGGKVLSTISTNSHVLLNSKNSDLENPPIVEWTQTNQSVQPLFAFDSNGNGRHEFISLFTDSEGYTDIYLHSSNGGLLWGWTVGKVVTNPANFIAGDFDGDGLKDIAFTFTTEEEGAMLYALKGVDGNEIGKHNPAGMITYFNNSATLLPDTNGDSINEILLVHSEDTEILNGSDLSRIANFDIIYWATNISISDFNGDGIEDIFANQRDGGHKQLFDLNGDVVWTVDTSWNLSSLYKYQTPYPGIAKIDSDEGFDIVLGGKFGDVSAYSGSDGSVLWRKCLNNGTVTDISVSVIPTSTLCSGSTLSNIVTGDIDGNGSNDLVVGDKLGNMYVIDINGELLWTMKFDGVLGNPILADVNNDGKIEIITGSGDGYLYAIGQKIEEEPDNDDMLDEDAIQDEDVVQDKDTIRDEDVVQDEDTDSSNDVDFIEIPDIAEDNDIVEDDEIIFDEDTADVENEDTDQMTDNDNAYIKSKDSGCGCSIL